MHRQYHTKPRGSKSGKCVDGQWTWQKVDWKPCKCDFFHSNRVIPDSYWHQWKKIKTVYQEKDNSVKYTNGIILVRGNKEIWVTQSYWNYFGFPKGSSTLEENDLIGALREFYEETGLDLEKTFPSKDFTKSDQIRWYDVEKRIQFNFFIIEVPSWFQVKTKPLDDVEITSFGWLKISNLHKIRFSKSMKEICRQFMEFRKSKSYEDFIEIRSKRLKTI